MEKTSRLISGEEIYQTELKKVKEHKDYRGSFSEIFQEYWNTCIEPVQWSLVKSKENVFRGMHLHKRHDEYFCLLTGHCLLALKDIRSGSPTEGAYSLYELFEEDLAALSFPKGLLHGWYFYTPSIHVQAVSEAYVDYGKDDNHGVIWNAPDLGIPWPMDEVVLSERAQDFPTEAELKDSLGDWQPFDKSYQELP